MARDLPPHLHSCAITPNVGFIQFLIHSLMLSFIHFQGTVISDGFVLSERSSIVPPRPLGRATHMSVVGYLLLDIRVRLCVCVCVRV